MYIDNKKFLLLNVFVDYKKEKQNSIFNLMLEKSELIERIGLDEKSIEYELGCLVNSNLLEVNNTINTKSYKIKEELFIYTDFIELTSNNEFSYSDLLKVVENKLNEFIKLGDIYSININHFVDSLDVEIKSDYINAVFYDLNRRGIIKISSTIASSLIYQLYDFTIKKKIF